MTESTTPRPAPVARRDADRHEKGSAMRLIAADNEAVEAKSARLKALRLESEAKEALIQAAVAKKKPKPAAKRAKAPAKPAAAKRAASAG